MSQLHLIKFQRILLLSILVANIFNANAIAEVKDSCRAFVLLGSESDYSTCSEQIQKALKDHARGVLRPSSFSWFYDRKLQDKFLNNVESGKPLYVSLAFEILLLLDGESAEITLMSLGNSITASAEVFLKNLNEHYGTVRSLNAMDSLLVSVNPEYIGIPEKELKIFKRRMAAIKNVRDPSLEDIKKIVLDEYRTIISEWKSYLKN